MGLDDDYYDERLSELSEETIKNAVGIYKNLLLKYPNLKEDSLKLISEDGLNDWMIPYHFTVGMKLRNELRDNGFLDNDVPQGNLDDYYIQLFEIALGAR